MLSVDRSLRMHDQQVGLVCGLSSYPALKWTILHRYSSPQSGAGPQSGDYRATIDGNGQTTPTIGIEVDATGPHGTVKNVAIISSTGTAAIEDFGTGIRSAAAATTVGGLDSVDVSSDGRGMVFNGASPVLLNVSADDNMKVGIQLNSGAAGGALVHVDASDNTAGSGIWINGANGTSMTDVTANGNNGIGVWLDGASNNSLVAFNANDNAIAGVFVGCNSAGPDGHTCVSVGRSASNGNSVMGNVAVATRSTADGQKWGVAIGSGNSRNHVVFVEGSGNTIDDGLDENTNCDANVWSLNTFTKTSPSHITPFCIGNP
jgi:hypothetical protein